MVTRKLVVESFHFIRTIVNVTSLAPFVMSLKNLIIILLRTLAIAGNRSYLDKRALYLPLNASTARKA